MNPNCCPRRLSFLRTTVALAFIGGFSLGQLYYLVMLKKIPFPGKTGIILSMILSLLLGMGNILCMQLRCICALTIPMYCGKPGRGVLKVVVLTYVIAGPITNMGLNAREVVKVFACSIELSQNLTEARYDVLNEPYLRAVISLTSEINQVQDTIRYIRNVIAPLECEIEDNLYETFNHRSNSGCITTTLDRTNRLEFEMEKEYFRNRYINKLHHRCVQQLRHAQAVCANLFTCLCEQCPSRAVSRGSSWVLCRPMNLSHVCSLDQMFENLTALCDSKILTNPGLAEGYVTLRKISRTLGAEQDVTLHYEANVARELYDVKDAKETGDMVTHAFEEKRLIMHAVSVAVDACVALLVLRIPAAAAGYHDQYLTNIDHDNVYVTSRFKRIDRKRGRRNQYTLLPLKKMERSKYVDVHSLEYTWQARTVLLAHVLKLLLEVVTATTFVMLDRLFYEALDVVRRHADAPLPASEHRDMEIEIEGTGALAGMVRKVLDSINGIRGQKKYSNTCLPQPTSTSYYYYLKIYGGYLWILLLLYIHPYTERLRRLVCSYFYPDREKQRILHLYNDILKKRMKMQKTLRRKALRAARTHYMSGESLLGLRMRWPQLLGWLRLLPAARMACLICGETEPRDANVTRKSWQSCAITQCPFVYCVECWREAGARCLACDAALSDISDDDSLTDDDVQY